ncbi:pyridoxamine 5'-phosphate oxidase family protein [Streptomyces sp. NPDC101171]|uniref:pyridoxamine 5'-phosphate oxidase family protein n=1 Tax=Streptomyces sp. NPDC101171 TaxID=3366122 RepID=UPI003820C7D3
MQVAHNSEALLFGCRHTYPATFTTLRRDGTPHVTPVPFAFDASTGLAQVTARAKARKARNVAAGCPAVRVALCQADGFRLGHPRRPGHRHRRPRAPGRGGPLPHRPPPRGPARPVEPGRRMVGSLYWIRA